MERVSVFEGQKPILIIAPHGPDDPLTAVIAEKICLESDCFGVINRGFERSDDVDYDNDKANCNNIEHCHEDVIKDEFLDPIMRYVEQMFTDFNDANILILHGMNKVSVPGDKIDVVVGYGAGKPPSHSCDLARKDAMLYILGRAGLYPATGKSGGSFAGVRKKNLNQLYRKWYNDPSVHSMQLEIAKELRIDDKCAGFTGEVLAGCVDDYVEFLELDETGKLPDEWTADWQIEAQKSPAV